MNTMKQLKALLKEKATEIKKLRTDTKNGQRARKYMGNEQYTLLGLSRDYRHHHIAYSELRGKTRDQIEQPKERDPYDRFHILDEALIAQIKETYTHEDVRVSAA